MKKSNKTTNLTSLSYFNWFFNLIQRLKFNPLKIFSIVLLYNVVTNVGSALYFNAWAEVTINNKIIGGLSQEPGSWIIFGLAQPMVFAIAVWLITAPDKMVNKLIETKALNKNSEVENILKWGNHKIRHILFYTIAWVMALGIQTFVILLEKGIIGSHNPTWINIHPIVFWSRTLIAIPVYYLLTIDVFCVALVIITLNRIMKVKNIIKVEIFHSDEAGGLGAIGKFIANLGYLSFTFAATIVVFFWQAKIAEQLTGNTGWFMVSVIASAVYLVIVPLIFFWPLLSTHQAMVAYREKYLQEISSELNKIYNSAMNNTEEVSVDKIDQIKHLTELREYTLKLPTWPFSTSSLRKYYSLSVSPILAFAVSLIYDWVSNKITTTLY